MRRCAAAHPLPDRDHLQGVRLLLDRFAVEHVQHEADRFFRTSRELRRRLRVHHALDDEVGRQLLFILGLAVRADQADWAWRVPQRRQKRALADSDRPHCPQLWTPMFAAAAATSRADASQKAPRAASSMGVGADPRDR